MMVSRHCNLKHVIQHNSFVKVIILSKIFFTTKKKLRTVMCYKDTQ